MHGKIDFRNGGAQQRTSSDFQVMRMKDMPLIETHITPSTAQPGGFDEHPVPPVTRLLPTQFSRQPERAYENCPSRQLTSTLGLLHLIDEFLEVWKHLGAF